MDGATISREVLLKVKVVPDSSNANALAGIRQQIANAGVHGAAGSSVTARAMGNGRVDPFAGRQTVSAANRDPFSRRFSTQRKRCSPSPLGS